MSKRVLSTVFGLMMVLSMLLTACAGTTSTAAPTDSSAAPAATSTTGVKPADTEAAPTEAAATQVPQTTRKGGWLDTIVFTSIDKITDAVVQLSAGAIDVYAYGGNDRDAFQATVDDPNLTYSTAYGNTVRAFMFNPAGPTFNDGRLNPFSNRKIREACNWLIDRKYITPEAVGPMGIPQTVVLISAMPDYVRYADLIRPLEAKYAYDFEKAKTAINDAMIEMGAELGSDGKWQYNGAPVVLIGLIRSEDDRTMIGNYFADQLEKVGFTVERQIRTRTELSPIWGQSDPPAGEWSFYTGGWGYNSIARNAGNLFDGYYTNRAGSTTGDGTGAVITPGSQADFVQRMMGQDTIYFDTDRYNIDATDQQALAAQAQWLIQYPAKRITIEGHADERGTREYNIALGARRAQTVRDYLASRGIPANRMRTISYGKERPVAVCNDISCWSQNRRSVTVLDGAGGAPGV